MIQYRRASASDAQNLKDIANRVIRTNYTPFLGEAATADFIASGMSGKEIDDGLANCTVMLLDNEIIGFVIINHNLLHLLMIDVHSQNSGYGSTLLAHIEKHLFTAFSRIRLQTFQENTAAVRFYLKNGWIIIAQKELPQLGKNMLQFEKLRP